MRGAPTAAAAAHGWMFAVNRKPTTRRTSELAAPERQQTASAPVRMIDCIARPSTVVPRSLLLQSAPARCDDTTEARVDGGRTAAGGHGDSEPVRPAPVGSRIAGGVRLPSTFLVVPDLTPRRPMCRPSWDRFLSDLCPHERIGSLRQPHRRAIDLNHQATNHGAQRCVHRRVRLC